MSVKPGVLYCTIHGVTMIEREGFYVEVDESMNLVDRSVGCSCRAFTLDSLL